MSCPSKFNGTASFLPPILNATPSHIKLTQPQMDTRLIYVPCKSDRLPLHQNVHPFWLISGSRDQCCFSVFSRERSASSASAHRYLNVWWLEGVPCFSGLLWRWLDLKCASCEPKPFYFPFHFPFTLCIRFHIVHYVAVSPRWHLNTYLTLNVV